MEDKKGEKLIFVALFIYAWLTIVGNLVEGILFKSAGEEVLYQIDMATIVLGFVLLVSSLIWRECTSVYKGSIMK